MHVGKNDKYLISKLKSYNITLDKIDSYLNKLSAEPSKMNYQDVNMVFNQMQPEQNQQFQNP